jgi:hypothetical protein
LTQSAILTPSLVATTTRLEETLAPTATRPFPTATSLANTPSASQVSGEDCNLAAPGSPIDVTIEDDSVLQPGESFTKVWRLVNAGSCTWTRDYRAEWFYGEKMGDTLSVPLNTTVAPGESVEIYVDMMAPKAPGTYQSRVAIPSASAPPETPRSGCALLWLNRRLPLLHLRHCPAPHPLQPRPLPPPRP